jgi:peptide/nickel transport system permease protein
MRHLLRRIGFYIVAFWASITFTFFLQHLAPGNPAEALMARFQGRLRPEELKALEIEFGVSTHASLWQQYLQYMNQILHGNLGNSFSQFPTPVATVIAEQLPWTLGLAGATVIISFILGTLLGIVAAWRRNGALDSVMTPLFIFISAIPYFWLALLLLYILAYKLNWFPVAGGYDTNAYPVPDWADPNFILSVLRYALLPAITIVVTSCAGWLLGMRNAMITTLSEDYVLMAEAKGLPQRRVMINYAARNAILPNVTGFGMALGFVVAGLVLTETVFSYPGIGYGLVQAVQNSDYPLVSGIFMIIAFAVLAANFIVDLLYGVLDPRVR